MKIKKTQPPAQKEKPTEKKAVPDKWAHRHTVTDKPRFASLIEPSALPPKPVEKKNGWVPIVEAAAAKNAVKAGVLPESLLPPPPFKPRINNQILPEMPVWGDIGKSLQHPEYRGGLPMTVRMGLDFGTAFTKVAIRAGVDLIPVEWTAVTGDHSETGRHLIPGLVMGTSEGEYCWQRMHETKVKGNLKLPLMGENAASQCPTNTIAYLALVIRYARAFLYRSKNIGDKLARRTLRWELNIGCPTEPHENPKIVNKFRHIARVAWMLAADEPLREKDIVSVWNLTDGGEMELEIETGLETSPGIVPEFVAQIAAYLKSPQVKNDLHILIDIGAATLDVATFNIVLKKDLTIPPRIPVFFSAVRLLGTHYLRYNRHQKLELPFEWDDAAPVETSQTFAQKNRKNFNEVTKADNAFMKQISECVKSVIERTRTNNYGSPRNMAWREGIPLFVTGGGAHCGLYHQAIERVTAEITARVQQVADQRNFRFIETDPTEINGQQFGDNGRLGVAIGLTEDAEDIAQIVPHHKVRPVAQHTPTFIDHSERYGD